MPLREGQAFPRAGAWGNLVSPFLLREGAALPHAPTGWGYGGTRFPHAPAGRGMGKPGFPIPLREGAALPNPPTG